jgi:hypothetical protein
LPSTERTHAVIDYERLAAADAESAGRWFDALAALGLDGLDATAPMPESLRALLAVRSPRPKLALQAAGEVLGLVTALVLLVLFWSQSPAAALFFGAFAPAYYVVGSLSGTFIDSVLRATTLLPPIPTRTARRDAALLRLRAEPFVVGVGGKVVENVPAMHWLQSQVRELDDATARCQQRIAGTEELAARLVALSQRLDDTRPDPQHDALVAMKHHEETLLVRIADLRAAVVQRQEQASASLERVRAAAELAMLRDRTAALLEGTAGRDDIARISADLEVELADLQGDVASLGGDLAVEEDRWRAIAEVASAKGVAPSRRAKGLDRQQS